MSDYQQMKRFKTLLEELIDFTPEQDQYKTIDNKAEHLYQSMIHFFQILNDEYKEDDVNELFKYFILSVKSNDYSKFKRKLMKVHQKKDNNNA